MALNLKNPEVEQLVAELARLTGETKTGAVLTALRERRARVKARAQRLHAADEVRAFLAEEVWSIPSRPSDVSDDELLGYGPPGA